MDVALDILVRRDIQELIQQLAGKSPVEREGARNALVEIGRASVIPLIHELKSPSNRTCWEVTKALGAIRDSAAATALAENLDHDASDVRWATAEALIAIGRQGLRQTLVALLTKSAASDLRRAARHVIWHFAHHPSGDLLRPLLARFNAFEPAVAIPPAALKALHEMEQGNLRL